MEKELKELGLSEYEIKAYLTLNREGTLTGNKLSKLSNVPQGKIYNTMYKLYDKGFISYMDSKPKLFKANDPNITVNRLIKKRKERLKKLESSLPKSIEELKKIKPKIAKTDEKVSIFYGKNNAFAVEWHLFESAKTTLDIIFTFEVIKHETWRILRRKKKEGVDIRVIATKLINKKKIKELIKEGFNIRYYPVEELRIYVRDEEESVQTIVNPNNLMDRTAVLIQSKELSQALNHYFDAIWKKARIIK
jgi:sugar-specific transcriptional regulator TrmB